MKQLARRISFAELRKLPEGTEFTACFTDDVKRGLPPVVLRKRTARSWAELTLDEVQILGTDHDRKVHAIPNGTADFSVTVYPEVPVSAEPIIGMATVFTMFSDGTFTERQDPSGPPVSPVWTAEELAVIQKLAAEKDMPPSQVLRQALRLYQMTQDGSAPDESTQTSARLLGIFTPGGRCVEVSLDNIARCEPAHGRPGSYYLTLKNGSEVVAENLKGQLASGPGNNIGGDAAEAWIRLACRSLAPHPPIQPGTPGSEQGISDE